MDKVERDEIYDWAINALEQFLETTELDCRRVARSCNEGTQAHREWIKTAEMLLKRRREHIMVCKVCGGKQ